MYFVKHSNSDEYVYRRAKMPMASNVIPRDNTPTITIIDVSTNARLCFNRIWSFSSFSYLVSAYYRVQPPSSKSDATLSPSIARKMPCVRTASRLSVVKITFEHISPAKLFLSFHWFSHSHTPRQQFVPRSTEATSSEAFFLLFNVIRKSFSDFTPWPSRSVINLL